MQRLLYHPPPPSEFPPHFPCLAGDGDAAQVRGALDQEARGARGGHHRQQDSIKQLKKQRKTK